MGCWMDDLLACLRALLELDDGKAHSSPHHQAVRMWARSLLEKHAAHPEASPTDDAGTRSTK